MTDVRHSPLIILGSGPAGYSAAVYAARANRKPLLITGLQQGGQLMTTTDVDNWPGDVEGLQGPALMQRMRKHAERFGTSIVFDHINAVDLVRRPFRLNGDSGEYTCDALIIATGASARYLGLPSEEKFAARACRPARPATGSSTRVSGSRSSAAATPRSRRRCTCRTSPRTSRWSIAATGCGRRRSCRTGCSSANAPARSRSRGTTWSMKCWATTVASPACACATAANGKTQDARRHGVFIAVGHTPNTQLFEGQLDMRGGYIVVKSGSTATPPPPAFPACSRRATWRTTCIARP